MASLVANYGSGSEDDTDSDNCDLKEERIPDTKVKVTNFFNQSSSSETESDSGGESKEPSDKIQEKSPAERLPNPLASSEHPKLSKPQFLLSPENSAKHSVFANQFQKAEDAKLSVLEQHVKLTNTEFPEGTDRKICKSFKKGKCRYGKKCKYLHALDPLDPVKAEGDGEKSSGTQEVQHNYYGRQSFRGNVQQEEVDEDSYMGQAKRKFRAGINDTLCPPKKALRPLEAQRSRERPWTTTNDQS